MTWIFGAVALLWILGLIGALETERDPEQTLTDAGPNPDGAPPLPAFDVVVPARDEESNLGPLLESLLEQSARPDAILVVDDRSEDRTAEIIEEYSRRDPRVRRIAGAGPPEGWTGKTAALAEGVRASTRPWLLFVDADVRLAPENLRLALREAVRRGWDGVSLWGRWEVPSLAARLLQSVIGGFVRGAHPIPRVNDPSKSDAFLNGQYLLIRRAAYDEIGGWDSVRDQVLEDVALARRAKRRGIRIGLLRAPDLMRVIPYRSIADIWQGYSKNFVSGAGGPARSLLAATVILVASVLPWLILAWDLATLPSPPARIATAAAACVATLAYRASTARLFHHPPADALWHPLANLAFVLLILSAVTRHLRGIPNTWKGRNVSS